MKFLILILIIAFLCACSRTLPVEDACGFLENTQEQRLTWTENLPITLYIDSSIPNNYVDSIHNAAKTWNDAGQSIINQDFFTFSSGDPGSGEVAQDGYNKIYLYGGWPFPVQFEGVTTTYWVGSRIFESDIKIDGANFAYFLDANHPDNSKIHLESLVLHELGHVIGLAHVLNLDSVMQPNLTVGQVRDVLGQTDLNDIRCGYKL